MGSWPPSICYFGCYFGSDRSIKVTKPKGHNKVCMLRWEPIFRKPPRQPSPVCPARAKFVRILETE